MASIGSLVVSLVAETAEFSAGMRRAENDVSRLSKHVASSNDAMAAYGKTLRYSGSSAADAATSFTDFFDVLQRSSDVESHAQATMALMDATAAGANTARASMLAATDAGKAFVAVVGGPWGVAIAAGAAIAAAGVKLLLDAQADLNRELEKGRQLDELINKASRDRFNSELDAIKASRQRQDSAISGVRGFGASTEAGLRSQIDTFGMSQSEADMHRLRQSMWQWRNDNAKILSELGPMFGGFLARQLEARVKNIEALQKELDKLREQASAQEQAARAAEEAARAQEHLHKSMIDAGRAIKEGQMTPLEAYERKLQDIMALEEVGAIDRAAADRAAAAAQADLERAGGKVPGQQQRQQSPGALLFGTAQAFSKEANNKTDDLVKLGERQVAIQEKNLPLLGRLGDMQKVALFSFT